MDKIINKYLGGIAPPEGEPDPGRRSWPAVLTSGSPDADGDRVLVSGIDMGDFLRNPVALLQHNGRAFPVGRWEKVHSSGKGFDAQLLGTLQLVPEGILHEADSCAKLIRERYLRGISIGFRVFEAVANEHGGEDFLRTKLFEASVVTLPANSDALLAASVGGKRQRQYLVDMNDVDRAVRDVVGRHFSSNVLIDPEDVGTVVREVVAREVGKRVRHALGRLD